MTSIFVQPMPPTKVISQNQIRIIQHHDNKGEKIGSNKEVEILFPSFNVSRTTRSLNVWDESHILPKWMKDYFSWHREQRKQMTKDNWHTFKYIVMSCLNGDRKCGGASDRLQHLPFIIRVAAETKRVILIKWDMPAPLESFLLPPFGGIDWRTPEWMALLLPSNGVKASSVARLVDVAAGMESIVKAQVQSHDHGSDYYNRRGEISGDGPSAFRQHYRDCWYSFFTPVPVIAKAIEDELVRMELTPGEFAVAHLRSEYDLEPGRHRDFLVLQNWTMNALNCISGLRPGRPLFFSSDSSEAKKIAMEYGKFRNTIIVASDADNTLDMAISTRAQDPALFYSISIDLYLMSMGRCYAYNVGDFGKWANLIGGRYFTCNIRYWTDEVDQNSATKQGCQWTENTDNVDSKIPATSLRRPMFLIPIEE